MLKIANKYFGRFTLIISIPKIEMLVVKAQIINSTKHKFNGLKIWKVKVWFMWRNFFPKKIIIDKKINKIFPKPK